MTIEAAPVSPGMTMMLCLSFRLAVLLSSWRPIDCHFDRPEEAEKSAWRVLQISRLRSKWQLMQLHFPLMPQTGTTRLERRLACVCLSRPQPWQGLLLQGLKRLRLSRLTNWAISAGLIIRELEDLSWSMCRGALDRYDERVLDLCWILMQVGIV